MTNNNHRYACMVEGILLGASMGAAAGLFLAPQAEKALKKVGSTYSGLHEKTEQVLDQAARSAENQLNRIKEFTGRE